MFTAIDVNKNKTVGLLEVQAELRDISADLILKKLKTVSSLKKMFYALDMEGRGFIDVTQFSEMVEIGYKKVPQPETDLLFRVVDNLSKGFVTLDDLTKAFSSTEAVQVLPVTSSPKDLFMPLLYKLKFKLNLNADSIFTKFKDHPSGTTLTSFG